jgi:hypothetical protein
MTCCNGKVINVDAEVDPLAGWVNLKEETMVVD